MALPRPGCRAVGELVVFLRALSWALSGCWRRQLSAHGDGMEFMGGVGDQLVEAGGVVFVDPLGERHPKQGDSGLCGDARGGLLHPPRAERRHQRRCQAGRLGEFPFVQLGVGVDQSLPVTGQG